MSTPEPAVAHEATQLVPLDYIAESPTNPRTEFPAEKMAELIDSVRRLGVLQPVLMRPWPESYAHKGANPPRFELVAGGRVALPDHRIRESKKGRRVRGERRYREERKTECGGDGVSEMAKPCPFCGHDDIEINEIEPGRFAIDCPECECIGPFSDSVKGAIKAWNKPVEQRDELLAALEVAESILDSETEYVEFKTAREQIRAAIASAKGGAE